MLQILIIEVILTGSVVSGEGLLVHQATGRGLLFVQSLGAIVERRLAHNEELIGRRELTPPEQEPAF